MEVNLLLSAYRRLRLAHQKFEEKSGRSHQHQRFNYSRQHMPSSTHKYHFISGLPRSGSTLLAANLRQNPRFHAGMSSPVGGFVTAILAQVSANSEFGTQVDNQQRKNLLTGLFDSYYKTQPDKDTIFDTNRMWCAKLPTLMDLFPCAKVIACVRNVAWVMDSIERQYRSNPYENTKLFGGNIGRSTVYQRLEGLAQHDQLVGHAWAALREAFYGEHAKSLLVIDYELLAQALQKVIQLLFATPLSTETRLAWQSDGR